MLWYPAAPRARVPGWAATLALVVLTVVLLRAGVGAAGGMVLGFAVLTPVERHWRRHDQPVRRPGLRTDLFHLLLSGGLNTAGLVVAVVLWAIVLFPFRPLSLAPWFQSLPAAVQAVSAFVALEVVGYLAHRLEHEVGFLWRFHAVHHSSAHLDWVAGARLHPMEGLIVGTIVAPPLLFLGVGPTTLGALGAITQLWGVLLHMNVRWRMRALDGVWSSPDFHHWHHSNHPEARNTNYAGFLPVLDRLFGTYHLPRQGRPTVYGIDEPMPDGWWRQLAHPFRRRPAVGRGS